MNGIEYDTPPSSLLSAPTSTSKTASGPEPSQEEEYEPYDTQLASKLQSLYASLESETLAVAELRRHAPLQAAALLREQLDREYAMDVDAGEVKDEEERAVRGGIGKPERGDEGVLKTGLEDLPLERRREMERNWEVALDELSRLKGVSLQLFDSSLVLFEVPLS